MAIVLDSFKQYTAEYWERHRGKPGGSDAKSIATPSTGKYPSSADTLINALIAQRFDPMYGFYEETASRAMRNGLMSEPQMRASYEFDNDATCREVGLVVSDDEFWCCSPDALIGDYGLVEGKVPELKTHIGYLRNGALPDDYRPQCHFNLIVTEREWVDWVSWSPYLSSLSIRVTRDDYTAKLEQNMERFRTEYSEALAKIEALLPPTPPPVIVRVGAFGEFEVTPQDAYF
jgi:hypothetical protein